MDRLLKIAIVDDMKTDRDCLIEKITCYMQSEELNYTMFEYESGEAFVAALEKERFDIVFMDIFMDSMTGVDAATILRRKDLDCKLVFITTSEDFWRNGFACNSAHYIVKAKTDDLIPHKDFLQAMKNCRIERKLDVPFLNIISEREPLCLHTTQIVYIDFAEKSTNIHLENHIYTVWESFAKTVEPLLTDRRFLQCFRGVLVNMDFVEEMEENNFLLKNGERLRFAIRDRKKLAKAYILYIMERAEERIYKK